MKKIIQLFRFLLLLSILLSCEKESMSYEFNNESSKLDVTQKLAKEVAIAFTKDEAFVSKPNKNQLNKSNNSSQYSNSEEKIIDEVIEFKSELGQTSLYVVKFLPKGYVIVPSTRKEVPILAFSDNGVFNENDIPKGLQDWIDYRTDIVDYLETNSNIEVAEEVKEQWYHAAPPIDDEEVIPGGSTYEQTGPLLQTRWGQGFGYNELVRFKNCTTGTTPTGCVATALGQIMRYHEYPNNYNWSIMPNQITPNMMIDSSVMEVAKLMDDLGQAVNMSYSCSGSGATADAAKNAFIDYGYSNYIKDLSFNSYHVVRQLKDHNQPVILRGVDMSAGGHAWVCDGFKRMKYITIHNPGTYYEYTSVTYSNFYLHMNWGWNDSINNDNNWFLDGTPSVGGLNFSVDYGMIIDIHP